MDQWIYNNTSLLVAIASLNDLLDDINDILLPAAICAFI